MSTGTPVTVDAYISAFPAGIQERLHQIRQTIQEAVPAATEAIKYGMPTFVYNGNMLSFGAYKNHIGLYPVPAGDAGYEQSIQPYKTAKSTLQFVHSQPLPLMLIKQTAIFRAAQMKSKIKQGEK